MEAFSHLMEKLAKMRIRDPARLLLKIEVILEYEYAVGSEKLHQNSQPLINRER